MIEQFMNETILSGYVNSKVKVISTKPTAWGVKFFIKVPRELANQHSYMPILCSAWGDKAKKMYEQINGTYGDRITIIGKWTTGIRHDGTQYFCLNVKDFVFGWIDLYSYPNCGEIEKNKVQKLVIEKTIKQIGEI